REDRLGAGQREGGRAGALLPVPGGAAGASHRGVRPRGQGGGRSRSVCRQWHHGAGGPAAGVLVHRVRDRPGAGRRSQRAAGRACAAPRHGPFESASPVRLTLRRGTGSPFTLSGSTFKSTRFPRTFIGSPFKWTRWTFKSTHFPRASTRSPFKSTRFPRASTRSPFKST